MLAEFVTSEVGAEMRCRAGVRCCPSHARLALFRRSFSIKVISAGKKYLARFTCSVVLFETNVKQPKQNGNVPQRTPPEPTREQ